MQVHVETPDVADRDELAMWTGLVGVPLIQVDCRTVTDHRRFHSAVTKLSLPRLDIARIKASGQTVTRTRQQIARAKEEHFLLNIQRRGSSLLRQGDREVVPEAGDCALYSSIGPYAMAFAAEFEQTALILPAALLRALNRNIDHGCAVRIAGDRPLTQLLLCTVDGLYNSAGRLPQPLGTGAIDLLAQTVDATSNPDACTTQHPTLARYHLARVKDFILRRLRDPELSMTPIATGLGMSPAHLHRLFARNGNADGMGVDSTAGILPTRARRSRAARTRHWRNRLPLGVQRLRPLLAVISQALRFMPARLVSSDPGTESTLNYLPIPELRPWMKSHNTITSSA